MTHAAGAALVAGSGKSGRPPLVGKVLFYVAFALLDVVAMSKEAFTLGLYLLVLPGLALAAIHWGFLLLPLIDWPLTAWRRTGRPHMAALWFGAALIVPVGVPATLNLVQAADVAIDRLGDVQPTQPAALAGPVLITGRCGEACVELLKDGTFAQFLHRERASPREWRDGAIDSATLRLTSTYCPKQRADESVSQLHGRRGWCVVDRRVENARFSAVIRLDGFEWSPERHRRRIEVYTCTDRCRLVARRTERRGSRLAVPLQIAYRGDSLYLDPHFKRLPLAAGDADPTRMLVAALGVRPGPGLPRLGEDPAHAAQANALAEAAKALKASQAEAERRIFLARQRRDDLAEAAERERQRERAQRNRRTDCGPDDAAPPGTFRFSCREEPPAPR